MCRGHNRLKVSSEDPREALDQRGSALLLTADIKAAHDEVARRKTKTFQNPIDVSWKSVGWSNGLPRHFILKCIPFVTGLTVHTQAGS